MVKSNFTNPKLQELLLAREAFLEKNSHLKEFQNEIDNTLRKAGSQHNRNVVIQKIMIDSVQELKKQLEDLLKF